MVFFRPHRTTHKPWAGNVCLDACKVQSLNAIEWRRRAVMTDERHMPPLVAWMRRCTTNAPCSSSARSIEHTSAHTAAIKAGRFDRKSRAARGNNGPASQCVLHAIRHMYIQRLHAELGQAKRRGPLLMQPRHTGGRRTHCAASAHLTGRAQQRWGPFGTNGRRQEETHGTRAVVFKPS